MKEAPMGDLVPIGKPVANTSCYIVDDNLNLLPIGVVGELCVGGVQVARGYLNRPDLTREKFIASPFTKGDRLYRTGDLARWLPDGTLEFIGRKDDQVKVRGYRIELGEIESVLSSLTGVVQSCVLAREDDSGLKSLVGYVVMEGDLDRGALEAGLSSRLPEYMVPRVWVELDEMPLTSNGKLDRRGLPDVDGSLLSRREYVAPRNAVEERLAGIWQELLGVDRVGVEDNFFELGGHSLLANRFIALMRKQSAKEISLKQFYSAPTITDISEHLKRKQGLGTSKLKVAPEMDLYPLSFPQERIWFLNQLNDQDKSYYVPRAIKMTGRLDLARIERTFTILVEQHEILRTLFLDIDGVPYQKIINSYYFKIPVISLQHIAVEKQEEEINRFIIKEGNLNFDLEKGPLLRISILQTSESENILVLCEHHLIHDGWTQGVLLREFMKTYLQLTENPNYAPPKPYLQFKDFAYWQKESFNGEILDRHIDFWESKLRDHIPVLNLPQKKKRPKQISGNGQLIIKTIDEKLARKIRKYSSAKGATLFISLLTAFKVVLSRFANETDICVGTSPANRRFTDLGNMLGMIINTIALRTKLESSDSLDGVFQKVKETCFETYPYEDTPFLKVVECLAPKRDLGLMPFFQYAFNFMNTPSVDLSLPELEIEILESHNLSSKFDINVTVLTPLEQALQEGVEAQDERITVYWEYNSDIYSEEVMEQLLSAYFITLETMIASPDLPYNQVQCISPDQEQQFLFDFNATQVDYPRDKTVVDLFESQARKSPDATAVVYEGTVLSYRELDARSNRLAGYLRDKGVEGETLVGLCIERSIEMLVGILGILKAGGAYVPIDPTYPEERITYMLEDGGIGLVLSSSASRSPLPTREGLEVVSLDGDWSSIAGYSSRELPRQASPSGLAYVIYTSGSTGRPKGVMVEHGGIYNRLLWTQSHYGLKSDDVVLQKTSFCFDVSVWELLWPMISGSKLVFAKPGGEKDASYLKEIIASHKVTTLHFVPSMLGVFLGALQEGDCVALRRVLCSGEALHLDHVAMFRERFRGVRLDNLYGPTEAAIDVSSWEVPLTGEVSTISIGKPVANTSCYIVDDNLNLLPIGVVGELCVGGVQVARGYLNRPDLTREKFIASPFTKGDRLYRTGDLARWLPDGTLEFIGRKDDQVKVRGYRIELGEIESVLSSLTGVVQSCVLAREDDSGLKSLVGYVVMEGDLDRGALEAGLSSRLPEYMVPRVWVELDEMPLTSNGKLDRRGLPDVDGSLLSRREYVAPRNAVEERLAGIWQELLGVDRVGVEDNFFELGGHSLLATRLVSVIRKRFEVEISITDIFIYKSLEKLANHLRVIRINKVENDSDYVTSVKI